MNGAQAKTDRVEPLAYGEINLVLSASLANFTVSMITSPANPDTKLAVSEIIPAPETISISAVFSSFHSKSFQLYPYASGTKRKAFRCLILAAFVNDSLMRIRLD
ncbi:hypothetical protein J4732_15735 [Serratia marcescens]|uniref:Uncharacterized protein n=1 Tax=Serratia marcescens TaxID=615 RepID=A0A939NQP2_SERMA|nr:hypothetical protein [Serratia marcescens]